MFGQGGRQVSAGVRSRAGGCWVCDRCPSGTKRDCMDDKGAINAFQLSAQSRQHGALQIQEIHIGCCSGHLRSPHLQHKKPTICHADAKRNHVQECTQAAFATARLCMVGLEKLAVGAATDGWPVGDGCRRFVLPRKMVDWRDE